MVVRSRSPCEAVCRQASANFWCPVSRRTRPSAGVAGPLEGFIALLVFAFGNAAVLPLDHPFVKEGRFASLLVRDRELADSLAEGFQELWRKAMKNLREIQVDPRGHKT